MKNITETKPSLLRLIAAVLLLQCLLIAGPGWIEGAYGGTPDRSGNNAEIYSITITPDTVPAGTYPEITGFVWNTSRSKNGKNRKAVFDVLTVITSPTGTTKRLLWHDVRFTADQRKLYKYVNNYDTNLIGTYRVEYFVYNSGRTHLYASFSKSFTVHAPAVTSKPQPPEETRKPPAYGRTAKTYLTGETIFIGIGGYVNTFDFSAGPTLILWPFKNLAFQGTYGLGTFTSYEARTFYRFPLSQLIKPYFGAGYLHAEKNASVLGTDMKIKGDSFTVFGGVELPLYKNLYGYVDVSGTPLKLRKELVNGTTQATATVKYSPVTVCAGLVLYLF